MMTDDRNAKYLAMQAENSLHIAELECLKYDGARNEALVRDLNDKIAELQETVEMFDAIESLGDEGVDDDNGNLATAKGAGKQVVNDAIEENGEGSNRSPLDILALVKWRTNEGDRKRKRRTPLEPRKMRKTKFYIDRNAGAVKCASGNALELVEGYWQDNDASFVIYKGTSTNAEVTMTRILGILHHEQLDYMVIDAFCDLLKEKLQDIPGVRTTMIFTARVWELVTGRDGARREQMLDSLIGKAMYKEILLFPLLAAVGRRNKHDNGDHWTLLKFTTNRNEWRLYNPKQLRRSDTIDAHAENRLVVIEYVEGLMSKVLAATKPNSALLKQPLRLPIWIDSLQQEQDGLDSGVVLLENVETNLVRGATRKGVFEGGQAARSRACIVEWFMDPDVVKG